MLLNCKFCGGELEITEGDKITTCKYCRTNQTLPIIKEERESNLFNRANALRRRCDFDKAEAAFEKIIESDGTEAEAYWGLVLSKYGIEYVDDKATGKMIPTCHRASYDSVIADEDYKSALEYADAERRALYEEQAKEIDRIQKEILVLAQKEESYDVFICYKETDENGKRTYDSAKASEIYYELTDAGFKVFYAAVTLDGKAGSEYEPIIFSALNSAKVMLVIGSKPEYFNAVWVKNEWSRFLKIMKKDRKKRLIPCYRDMDAYDLPEEFVHIQAQNMEKMAFLIDLIQGVKKVMTSFETKPEDIVKETVVKEPAMHEPVKENTAIRENGDSATVSAGGVNTSAFLRRAFMFLEDGDFESADEYCEKVLDIDPENAQAYLGKLMAELKISACEDLYNCDKPFDDNSNYKKSIRYGSVALKEELERYIREIKERNEAARKEQIYLNAIEDSSSNDISRLQAALDSFKSIIGYNDVSERIGDCEEKIKNLHEIEETTRRERERQEETARLEREKRRKRNEKIVFISAPIVCVVLAFVIVLNAVIIPNVKYNDALSLMDKGKYAEAIAGFEGLSGYKNSEDKIKECNIAIFDAKYNEAIALMNVGKYIEAINMLDEIEDYKDALVLKKKALLKNIKLGDYVKFGVYEQDNNTSNGKEEIEWLVLDIQDGKALVISKYGLDCKKFNETQTNITWEKCTLRKWLNNDFINTAFSAEEKAVIPTVTVSADKNPAYKTNPGNATQDKVFVLSIPEANKYFSSNHLVKLCKPTEYANAWGVYEGTGGYCYWWLRTPGNSQSDISNVTYAGNVNAYGDGVKSGLAVRPVMWIDLNA